MLRKLLTNSVAFRDPLGCRVPTSFEVTTFVYFLNAAPKHRRFCYHFLRFTRERISSHVDCVTSHPPCDWAFPTLHYHA